MRIKQLQLFTVSILCPRIISFQSQTVSKRVSFISSFSRSTSTFSLLWDNKNLAVSTPSYSASKVRLVTCMTRGVKKEHLPSKVCVTCGRPFTWRKKWERCWDEVTTCSKSCNGKRRLKAKEDKDEIGSSASSVSSNSSKQREGDVFFETSAAPPNKRKGRKNNKRG